MKRTKNIILLLTILLSNISVSYAAEIVQQFKDPSFTSNGWSTQMFTVYQTEQTNKQANANAQAAAAATAASNAANTPLAKFMSLFSSQVYAQLATQLSNNLFQNNCKDSAGNAISGCVNSAAGSFSLDGNTVTYVKSASNVELTVVDSAGNKTIVTVPIAQFAF